MVWGRHPQGYGGPEHPSLQPLDKPRHEATISYLGKEKERPLLTHGLGPREGWEWEAWGRDTSAQGIM